MIFKTKLVLNLGVNVNFISFSIILSKPNSLTPQTAIGDLLLFSAANDFNPIAGQSVFIEEKVN